MRLCAALTLTLVLVAASVCSAQVTRTRAVEYPEWGFSAQVPVASEKSTLTAQPGTSLAEVYWHDSLGYVIRVLVTPPDSLASTAIEQALQAQYKEAADQGARRWELLLKNEDLFKGLSRPRTMASEDLQKFPALNAMATDGVVWESVCYLPLGDEASAILGVGLMGPASRQQDVETGAMALAHSVARLKSRPVQPPAPVQSPKPVAKPVPPQLKNAAMSLAKGQIEVIGKVEAVSADGKTLTLSANTIRMPGQKPIPLGSPRTKVVRLGKPDPLAAVGAKASAIGKNEGVGSALNAEVLEVLEPAAKAGRA